MTEMPAQQDFSFHPAVERLWWSILDTRFGRFGPALKSLPQSVTVVGDTMSNECDVTDLEKRQEGFLRVRVEAKSNNPHLRFWVYQVYGSTETARSSFDREPLHIEFAWGDSITFDPEARGHAGHGQAILDRFEVDCQNIRVYQGFSRKGCPRDRMPPFMVLLNEGKGVEPVGPVPPEEFLNAFEETAYAPAFPGKTGDQPVFGIHFLMRELARGAKSDTWWFEQLKNEACRPGHLYRLNEDGDRFEVVDDEYVDRLVFGGNSGKFHDKSSGYDEQAWFKPEGSSWVAKAQTGSKWKGWDRQHWGLGPLCQAYIWYRDPGLFWLIESAAGTWLLSNPVENKGTAHHVPKNARGHGRSLQSGAHLYFALVAGGCYELANKVRARLQALVSYQARAWSEDGVRLNREGYASAWMHAEWVNGLMACVHILDLSSLTFGSEIASFVVACFKHWGDQHWAIPYKVTADGQAISDEPTNGLTEWCLATVQVLKRITKDDAEKSKCRSILKQWIDRAPVSHDGSVPSRFRWVI